MDTSLGGDTAGLYAKAMETTKCEQDSSKDSGESDFSGDFDEKPGTKKDGKLVKKKDKEEKEKEKKKDKDKGYAALEGESSQDETDTMDVKSPFKGKKRSFKFSSSRKEKKKEEEKDKKKEKEKEKEKDKDKDKKDKAKDGDASLKESRSEEPKSEKVEKKKDKKEKDKEKEKELKSKEIKSKLKIKEKKKSKGEDIIEGASILPVFGVPLELAVQRSRCHDGVDLPVVVRNCINYIEEFGLNQEGIYRSSGVKTRVVELRRAYNNRENVCLKDVEPPIVASLLKQFLRELPDNLLTTNLLAKFEEAAAIKDVQAQKEQLARLVQQLPKCNRILLSWLMVHMEHVIEKERYTKMNVQNLSIVLTPTLNLSPRVLNAFFVHTRTLFADTKITRYIPPLSGVGVRLPEDIAAVSAELEKQESLLAQIHDEMCSMSAGSVPKHREEQLWEAQRIVTQLKRQLKMQVPNSGRSLSLKEPVTSEEIQLPSAARNLAQDEELRLELAMPPTSATLASETVNDAVPTVPQKQDKISTVEEDPSISSVQVNSDAVDGEKPLSTESDSDKSQSCHVTVIEIGSGAKEESDDQNEVIPDDTSTAATVSSSKVELQRTMATLTEEEELELKLKIENEERERLISQLREAIENERYSVEQLQELIAETGALRLTDSSEEDENFDTEEQQEQVLAEVLRQNRQLEEQNMLLCGKIDEAREACLQLRVKLRLCEEKMRLAAAGPLPCQVSN